MGFIARNVHPIFYGRIAMAISAIIIPQKVRIAQTTSPKTNISVPTETKHTQKCDSEATDMGQRTWDRRMRVCTCIYIYIYIYIYVYIQNFDIADRVAFPNCHTCMVVGGRGMHAEAEAEAAMEAEAAAAAMEEVTNSNSALRDIRNIFYVLCTVNVNTPSPYW